MCGCPLQACTLWGLPFPCLDVLPEFISAAGESSQVGRLCAKPWLPHFPSLTLHLLGPVGSGPTCQMPRAPSRKIEEAQFERKAPHLYVPDSVSWWKPYVLLLSTNSQLQHQTEACKGKMNSIKVKTLKYTWNI